MTTQLSELNRPALSAAPGSIVTVRDADWLVTNTTQTQDGLLVEVTGLSELVRDTRASFYGALDDIVPLDPRAARLRADDSLGHRQTRLWLESTFRRTPTPLGNSPLTAIAAAALRGHPLPGEAPTSWFSRYGGFASADRLRLDQAGKTDFALILDDGVDAIDRSDFHEDWRLWLHLSNLAVWRDSTDELTIAALSQISAPRDDGSDSTSASIGAVDFTGTPLNAEWSELVEQSTPAERAVLVELAAAGGVETPKLGAELGDGIPISFVWEEGQVASAWDLTAHDRASLEAAGWVVASPDAPSIIAALAAARS